MTWVATAIGVSAIGAYSSAKQQGKANAQAMAMNQANIDAAIGAIGTGFREAELSLDEIMKLAEQRAGEEGKVSADYRKAEEQLKEGHEKSMGRLAGAEGQMQDQMQAMFEVALGGAIGGAPGAALGGGSMGFNMARLASGEVMRSGMPLELTKLASGQEAQYGTQRAGLTTAKSGAKSRAREQYLGGMQQAHQSYATLDQWQADSLRAARTAVQYEAADVPNYAQGLDFDPLIAQYAANNPGP